MHRAFSQNTNRRKSRISSGNLLLNKSQFSFFTCCALSRCMGVAMLFRVRLPCFFPCPIAVLFSVSDCHTFSVSDSHAFPCPIAMFFPCPTAMHFPCPIAMLFPCPIAMLFPCPGPIAMLFPCQMQGHCHDFLCPMHVCYNAFPCPMRDVATLLRVAMHVCCHAFSCRDACVLPCFFVSRCMCVALLFRVAMHVCCHAFSCQEQRCCHVCHWLTEFSGVVPCTLR